jgi:hypothetical protein
MGAFWNRHGKEKSMSKPGMIANSLKSNRETNVNDDVEVFAQARMAA